MHEPHARGPLSGVTVIELAGLGPAPFCAMLLADMGARVIRVDRPPQAGANALADLADGPVNRGRQSIALDLRKAEGLALLLELIKDADILLEGFRPGVAEKLGCGPEVCQALNPRLIYARMTGWGQYGPLAPHAGHDINYIALSGALHAMGDADRPPVPPLNLVGDYGGGGMMMAFGIVCALHEAHRSGLGQVIDAAMTDGAAQLMAPIHAMRGRGHWRDERSANLLDGHAPFYRCYTCRDGRFMAVGAIEPPFYKAFLEILGCPELIPAEQWRQATWDLTRRRIAARFLEKDRDEWAQLFEHSDACCTPVLNMAEASRHPHIAARNGFVECGGELTPAPAPRLSRTPARAAFGYPRIGEDSRAILTRLGLSDTKIDALMAAGTVAEASQTTTAG